MTPLYKANHTDGLDEIDPFGEEFLDIAHRFKEHMLKAKGSFTEFSGEDAWEKLYYGGFILGIIGFIQARETAILKSYRSIEQIEGAIGEDEKPKYAAKDGLNAGVCMLCYENDYCIHEIRDELRAEIRKALGLNGGEDG